MDSRILPTQSQMPFARASIIRKANLPKIHLAKWLLNEVWIEWREPKCPNPRGRVAQHGKLARKMQNSYACRAKSFLRNMQANKQQAKLMACGCGLQWVKDGFRCHSTKFPNIPKIFALKMKNPFQVLTPKHIQNSWQFNQKYFLI